VIRDLWLLFQSVVFKAWYLIYTKGGTNCTSKPPGRESTKTISTLNTWSKFALCNNQVWIIFRAQFLLWWSMVQTDSVHLLWAFVIWWISSAFGNGWSTEHREEEICTLSGCDHQKVECVEWEDECFVLFPASYHTIVSHYSDNRHCSTFSTWHIYHPPCTESAAENTNSLQVINKTLPSLLLLLTVDPAEHHHILKNIGNGTQRIPHWAVLFNLILKSVLLRKQSKCDYAAHMSILPCSLLSLWLHLTKFDKKFNKRRAPISSMEMDSLVENTKKLTSIQKEITKNEYNDHRFTESPWLEKTSKVT